jgi:hypothetical protein
MTSMVFIFLFIAFLIAAFLWSLRTPQSRPQQPDTLANCEPTGRSNATYLPLIRQALSSQDLDYVRARGNMTILRRTRRERRLVALAYLAALRIDFRRLLNLARVIASLSPEVDVTHETERLRLIVQFTWRFELIRLRLLCNAAAMPQLDSLGEMVSNLSVRLEAAVKELGERAALAGEIASSLDRRGLDSIG